MQMQRKQFLAQASYLHFDQETQSPFKIKAPAGQADQETQALATEASVQIETINFIKLPPGLYGLKALQFALHELLCTMGKANYSATTSLISITSETCGTDLLKRLNDTISPKSGDTTKQAKNNYTTHKDSFHDDTDFVTWWTTLLLLQTTNASLGIMEATHMDALDDACETIEEKTGCSSRWSMEIMAWKMKCKSGAQSGDLEDPDDIDAVNAANAVKITSFEYHMRLHQQRRDTSGAKKEKTNAVNLKNPDYCAWCFKNTGKKWNNHSEATCNNK
jgi:hypothetical protein